METEDIWSRERHPLENTIKRERYGVGGVDEGLTIYGTRRVLPVASERPRRYGAMLGKQKNSTEQLAFVK